MPGKLLYLTPFNAMSIATAELLKKKGCCVAGFFDNNDQLSGKTFRQLPISKPFTTNNAELMIFYYKSDALYKQAKTLGYNITAYPFTDGDLPELQAIWESISELELADVLPLCVSMKAKDTITNHFMFNKTTGKKVIGNINLIITEKCSLRCKSCSALISYFAEPETYQTDEIINGLTILLDNIDFLYECFVQGGEPFLHPDIIKIANACCTSNKIGQVTITTNGTILPSTETLEALAKYKNLTLRISDYGRLSKQLDNLVERCNQLNLSVSVMRGMKWYDFAKLLNCPNSEADATRIYSACNLNCASLAKNYFSKCNMALSRRFLKAVPDVKYGIEDIINVYDQYFHQQLIEHLESDVPLKACSVCSGKTRHEKRIQPAEQAEHPIIYKKY